MGKRYKDALKTFDRQRNYPVEEALKIVQSNAKAKFDETIEVHYRLGIDPRHSDQQVRTTVMLPHGTGKSIRILAFVDEQLEESTLAAGADIIGTDDVINQIRNEGWLEFDHRHPADDAQGGADRAHTGSARLDAQSQGGHGGAARRYPARHQRVEGGPGGVSQ